MRGAGKRPKFDLAAVGVPNSQAFLGTPRACRQSVAQSNLVHISADAPPVAESVSYKVKGFCDLESTASFDRFLGRGGNFVEFAAIVYVMTMKVSTENSLIDEAIRRVRDGETAAFEVVVRRFERPLRAWLAVQAPPGVDVDEVAQRSFVTAFSRLGKPHTWTR